MALLLKGSGWLKVSGFEGFLKKSSEELLKGSASLKGSPPKGSKKNVQINITVTGKS